MNRNPVGWFEIYVDDIERAKAFYQTVMDVKLTHLDTPGFEMWGFPMDPKGAGCSGSLIHMKDFKAGGNSTLVYFSSDDCAVEEARVEGAGGTVFKTKFSIGEHGNMSLAYDTEGNMFGIHSMK